MNRAPTTAVLAATAVFGRNGSLAAAGDVLGMGYV
jgi:hypothetical protein